MKSAVNACKIAAARPLLPTDLVICIKKTMDTYSGISSAGETSAWRGSTGAAPLNQTDKDDDNRHHQQDVNESPQCGTCDKSQYPEDQKDDGDGH